MNPWNIIGWTFIILVAVSIGGAITIMIFHRIKVEYLYHRSKNIPPASGQTWMQGCDRLLITNVYENGNIGIASDGLIATTSWGETQEEWRERVKNRRLYLMKE